MRRAKFTAMRPTSRLASLEQSVEMRNVSKADLERNFGDRSPLLFIDQTLRAKSDPPVI
jgi:hypothetical protein